MDNMLFCKSFGFVTYAFRSPKHNDNSAGIECHFIGRLLNGTATLESLDGQRLSLTAGDIFYIPMGLKYHSYWRTDVGGALAWESYRFLVFPDSNQTRYALQKLSPDSETLAFLDRIAMDKRVSLSNIGRLYCFLGGVLPDMRKVGTDPREQLLLQAKAYIAKHPDFRVVELARYCKISESGLYVFFRTYAHTTPIGLKNSMQMEKAISLLHSTDLPFEKISIRCGFESAAYFRKLLEKHTGKTPAEIRKERQNLI